MFTTVNTLLFVDFYWVTIDPFTPAAKRFSRYMVLILAQALLNFVLFTVRLFSTILNRRITEIIFGINTFIYMSVAITCLTLMIKTSLKQKLSKQLQNRILIRYLLYYIVFLP